jgi:hypothetical protein
MNNNRDRIVTAVIYIPVFRRTLALHRSVGHIAGRRHLLCSRHALVDSW